MLDDLDKFGRDGGGVADERRQGTLGDESSRIERDDVVADALDLFEKVTREEDIDAVLGADLTDQGQHLVALDGIETVGGFIEQHERGIGGDRLGELHPLALTGRHGAERPKAFFAEADEP